MIVVVLLGFRAAIEFSVHLAILMNFAHGRVLRKLMKRMPGALFWVTVTPVQIGWVPIKRYLVFLFVALGIDNSIIYK